jgi:hypothetical protein
MMHPAFDLKLHDPWNSALFTICVKGKLFFQRQITMTEKQK